MGPMPCVLHVHAQTHTFIRPVTCLLCSCCVVLWFLGHPYPQLCCMRLLLVLLLFVLFFVGFFSVCLLTGAPGGSLPGFPTEAVGCLLFGFSRCSGWLSSFLLFSRIVSFYFCPTSFSLLSLFPCPLVRFGTITCKVF